MKVRNAMTAVKCNSEINTSGTPMGGEFYISIPNTHNPKVVTEESGRFTHDYKYGRKAGEIQEYVKVVPFDSTNIPGEVVDRMQQTIPESFKLIDALRYPIASEENR